MVINHSVSVQIHGPMRPGYGTILTSEAVEFIAQLARHFTGRRDELLAQRQARQQQLDRGEWPDFLAETTHIRESAWRAALPPADLLDRRVEITGPTDRKMVINALNSGASVFMADFEDATAPTWHNLLEGQLNLYDAVRRRIDYTNEAGKSYRLNDKTAVLLVRPRGWHLNERHIEVDGQPMPASLFDFGLYFFHNAQALLASGTGPYFYLPKLESHLEARLWNDVFVFAQDYLDLPQGTIRATVLIETILASFELHEIIWELREHCAGLNCGRWDYIFSFIKKFRVHSEFIMPDRSQVTMTSPFMRAYTQLVIRTCHQRGIHAMGGMAAQIPIKNDEQANEIALERVRRDKEREAQDGHDGTWVAHPGLVPLARAIFDAHMPDANQIETRPREDVTSSAQDLLAIPTGTITEEGIRTNIRVGIQYLEAWLNGIGCVPLYNLMEDAATAEICRAQLWQWIHHQAHTDDDQPITIEYVTGLVQQELAELEEVLGAERYQAGAFDQATHIFRELITQNTFTEFLTLPAYELI